MDRVGQSWTELDSVDNNLYAQCLVSNLMIYQIYHE